MDTKAKFLNVDLEIESATELDSLADELRKKLLVIHSGHGFKRRFFLSLESYRQYKTPDATIRALCSAVEGLSPGGCRIWRSAQKVFDVGFELPSSEKALRFKLDPESLKRITKLGATLAVSCYREE